MYLYSANASGCSTPTHSLNEGSSDGLESDQSVDVRSIKSHLPSTSKEDEYDSNHGDDFPPLQHRSVRNPLSVMQRISSLMAIRNNVSIKRVFFLERYVTFLVFGSLEPGRIRTIHSCKKKR